nr:hypothetical protein [Chitinophagaceae bacterium]
VLQLLSANAYGSTIIAGTSIINASTGGKIIIGNGVSTVGTAYETFATSSANTWNDASVFEWNTPTTFAFNNATYFPSANASTIPIFRVSINPGIPTGTSASVINGILEVNASFAFTGGGAKTFRNGIRGTATLTQNASSGSFNLSTANAILDGASLNMVLASPLNLSTSTIVPPGANVIISGANINNSSGAITVNGVLDVTIVQITNPSGTVTVNGTYKTAHSGGLKGPGSSIPSMTGTVILNPGSTIEYNALGTQSITTAGVSYHNITLSGSGNKIPKNALTPTGTVNITGSAILDASNHNIGDGTTLTNLTMDGGRLIVGTTGTQPMMAGTYILTGGVVEFSGASSQTIRTNAYQNIEVTGIGVGNSNGNISLNSDGIFTVKSGGVFVINSDAIIGPTGTQTVTVENGARFRCGNNQGFNGYTSTLLNSSSMHQNIENIILNTGSTVEYIRNGDQPISNSNSLEYSNLLISGTGIKTAQSGILTVNGNVLKSGTSTFAHNGGTVLLNGTNQSFAGLTYNNLILSNGTKTTYGNCTIIDSIKISTAILMISANDSIFLHSDAVKTARAGQVEGNITYGSNSKFVVERYIPGHRAWRLLTAPVANTLQTINQAWQEGTVNPDLIYANNRNPRPGYGTHITGTNRATDPTYGFDPGPQNNTSIKYYNNGWIKLPSGNGTNNSLINSQPAFLLFVRGDRS